MSTLRTALYDLHLEAGARMTTFAGYEMPLRYPEGTIAEHLHTRREVSLFDVSHMGVIEVRGPDRAAALEHLVPSDILGLAPGRARYTFLTNAEGGILDDLVIHNLGDRLVIVANADRKLADLTHLESELGGSADCALRDDLSILALQGPQAEAVIRDIVPAATQLTFMRGIETVLDGAPALISRSGYTGEDGFELIVPAEEASRVGKELLSRLTARWAGLGARDTLRLEAGLCLYGQDLDPETSPVEAGLSWAIQKRRRENGGFLGWEPIRRQLDRGPDRIRVGIRPEGRAPVREGAALRDRDDGSVGRVTSGGFGPSVAGPIAMGYVPLTMAAPGTVLTAVVRDKRRPCRVADLPFVPHRYQRGGQTT